MKNNWVENFMNSTESLHIDNFNGTENLIMICPTSANCNYWLRDSKQEFWLSKSGKRLYVVENGSILKQWNIKSIASFGYTKLMESEGKSKIWQN